MPRDVIERLKSRIDIVDVLSGYITLKRAGRNYMALCPFHNEKTPSFMVSPEKQMFHCFGCGAGGDALGFVMKYESMGFSEAVRLLAEKAGLDAADFAPAGGGGAAGLKRQLAPVLKEARDFYAKGLEGGSLGKNGPARQYLEKRGVSGESIKRFALGYAPSGWGQLLAHLMRLGFSEDLIFSSGVARRGQSGQKKLFDMLRDRIVFPIAAADGLVIAFGGRIMDAPIHKDARENAGGEATQKQPKYLNTADSPLFKKGETLYGFDLARDAVRKKEYLVLCEGYLDVIMCHQHGFENVAAPLGTALTPAHLRKLKRYANRLVLVFDGDAAGISAAKRAIALALEQDFRVKIAIMPSGEDPDSLLRSKGPVVFKKALAASLGPVQFILKTAKGQRVDIIKEAMGLLHRVQDTIVREEFIRELAEAGKIREQAIRQEMERQGGNQAVAGGRHSGARNDLSSGARKMFGHTEETLLLSVFVNAPEKRARIIEEAGALDEMEDPLVKALILKLGGNSDVSGAGVPEGAIAAGSGPEGFFPLDLTGAAASEFSQEEVTLLTRVSIQQGFSPDEADGTISGCVRKIRLRGIEKRIAEAGKKGDVNLLKNLYRDKEAIKGGDRTDGQRI